MHIANQIIIEAVDGKAKKLKPLLHAMVEGALEQKGCQKYELYQLEEDRQIFFIIEIWKNEKRYRAHLQQSAYRRLADKTKELIEISITNPLKSAPAGDRKRAKRRES